MSASAVEPSVGRRATNGQLQHWFDQGFSDRQIAQRLGCTPQNIFKRRKRLWNGINRDATLAYRESEALLLDDTKRLVLSEIRKPGRLEKVALRDLTILYGVIFDKAQLVHGRSTANLSLHVLVEQVERAARTPTGSGSTPVAAIPAAQVPATTGPVA